MTTEPDRALDAAVQAFLDRLEPVITGLAARVEGIDAGKLRTDLVVEAFNIATACIDSDGLHTDNELLALTAAFAHRMDGQIRRAEPSDLRDAGLLVGRRHWLERPSPLFSLLIDADARDGTDHAGAYIEQAARIGHVIGSIDLHVSAMELEAIEAFRGMLLRTVAGNRRTGARPLRAPTRATPATEATPDEPARPLDELLAELDELVGLDAVKAEVHLVANLIQVQNLRRERGLPVLEQSRHLVFTGNPGTGKTTVARLLAQIFRTLGVVARGHLVETDRSGLVAGYVGQTAPQVVGVFDTADQGVLLIDEAYSLVRGGERDFGREAIDTIVKLIEDRRDRIVVIMAGYTDEMAELLASNPGLRSRFPKTIHFPDYSTGELLAIIDSQGRKGGYHLDDGARAKARRWFDACVRDKGFGNARTARNLFEWAVAAQATRLVRLESPTNDELTALTAADLPEPGQGPAPTAGPSPPPLARQ